MNTVLSAENVNADEANEDQIKRLMQHTRVDQILMQIVSMMHQQGRASISSGSMKEDDPAYIQMMTMFDMEYEAEVPALGQAVQKLYVDTMPAEALTAALNFYDSDAGQAFLQAGQQIEMQLQQTAESWGKAAGKAAFDRAITKLQEQQTAYM